MNGHGHGKERAHSDFNIIASGKSFPVHRYTLHQSSEYFRAMLAHGMKELSQGYCEANDDALTAEQCIEFMYSGKMNLRSRTVTSILKLSHRWLLNDAVTLCVDFMRNNVSPQNCVEWMNISKLYAFHELETICSRCLVQNLSKVNNLNELEMEALQSLAGRIPKHKEHAKVMWNWMRIRIQLPDCDNPCRLIQVFCVENLTKAEFQTSVLKDDHITSCHSCKEYVMKRRLAYAYKIEDAKIENCLFIKDEVVKYGAVEILPALDKYIVKHFRRVCMREEFLALVTEERLLLYICKIHRSCTEDEFKRIVEWLRTNPERELSFPKLFSLGRGVSSKFKNCLHSLTDEDTEYWLFDSSNCCYLRSLAEKYSLQAILEETDEYLGDYFEDISSSVDIVFLSVQFMKTYTKTEHMYDVDHGRTMWNAVRLWADDEKRHGAEEFCEVFCSLLFDKTSHSVLQEICSDDLVKKSVVCCSKLLEVAFSRISQNMNHQEYHLKGDQVRHFSVHWEI